MTVNVFSDNIKMDFNLFLIIEVIFLYEPFSPEIFLFLIDYILRLIISLKVPELYI